MKKQSSKDKDLFSYIKNGKTAWGYRYRYYDSLGNRKEKSKQGFVSENEAFRSLLKVKQDILNGDIRVVENSNTTVAQWADIWFDAHKDEWKISTMLQRKSIIKDLIKPLLGKYKLAELDKITYKRAYINELSKKYAPSSVRIFHKLFQVMINSAVDNEIIARNRFNRIPIESDTNPKLNFLSAEELNDFLKAAESQHISNYTFILLLAYTGLRRGEAFGLKWCNFDEITKTITVESTRDSNGFRAPKTKNSYRTIVISDELVSQLKKYRTWCKTKALSLGKRCGDDDFILISRNGTPMSDTTIRHMFIRVCKKANISNEITPHGLRHTHATILMGQRIPIKVIADRLGNTPTMILDIYGHTLKEMELESVDAFSSALMSAGGSFGGSF